MGQAAENRPIVIRRIKKVVGGGHHGGAWKIAYADFVTAMMAFFLLMWLLGSTTKGELKGIADYFNTPLKVALAGGSGSGDSSSILNAGGTDLTHTVGQQQKTDKPDKTRTINLQAAQAEKAKREHMQLEALKGKLEKAIQSNGTLKQFAEQIRLDFTPEGLRIQIIDEQNRPMFDSGHAVMKPHTRDILGEIARGLNGIEHKVTISGHTDATPYSSGDRGYSNWELSADRANAARREMLAAGMDDKKVLRVVGLASAVPLNPADPMAAANRRISIIIVNKKTEDAIMKDGKPSDREGEGKPSDATTTATPL